MKNLNLQKAEEINEYNYELPQLEVGDEVKLSDVWDGEGNVPDESYSYQLTDTDWLNYEFEILEKDEDNPLNTIVKITAIELI